MVEIASLPPSLLAPELSSPASREERGRRGDKDVVPFGQLVSAQARPAHANGQGQPPASSRPLPAPLDRPVERAEKPDAPPKSRAARAADRDDAPNPAANPPEQNPAPPQAENSAGNAPSNEAVEETNLDSQAGDETEETAEILAGPIDTLEAELVEAIDISTEIAALPAEISAEALNEAAANAASAPADLVEAPAVLLATAAEAPAATSTAEPDVEAEAVITALGSATGESRRAAAAALAAPLSQATSAAATPEAPAPSAAEAFAKLTARSAETPVANRAPGSEAPAKAPAASDLPKANFGDWINDFALSQGALHRSGDLVGSLDRALAALPTPHAGQDALRPTPLQMLPIEIGMQAMRGVTKFQIRLDPAELGRVDVKLEFREDGQVKANLVVDRVETLAMLKRDAHTLQQAFEQAGLRQPPDGLQFSLRGEGQQREGQRDGEPRRNWSPEDEKLMGEMPPELALRRVMIPNSSLDLMV